MNREEKADMSEKAIFFAQYWGQEIHNYKLSYSRKVNKPVNGTTFGYVLLKPLSEITVKDAIEVAKMTNSFEPRQKIKTTIMQTIEFGKPKKWCRIYFDYKDETHIVFNCSDDGLISHQRGNAYMEQWGRVFDFLRSRGYALPWMGISVDEMVTLGWVKLLEN